MGPDLGRAACCSTTCAAARSGASAARPHPQRVTISGFPSIFAVGEGGLLGMVADPAAATNGRFYTCQAVRDAAGAPLDVRVLRWRMTSDTTAVVATAPRSSPAYPSSSGRHSGCRLRFGTDGCLYVGTGDAAVGTNPQNLASLGGKVLRVGWDGTVPADNPFVGTGGNARLRVDLRPPQRPGPRPAPGDQRAVVGRARHRPRRRGQPSRARRQLRLGPGARATTSRGP